MTQTFEGTWSLRFQYPRWMARDISMSKVSGGTPQTDASQCGASPEPSTSYGHHDGSSPPQDSNCDPSYEGACLDPNSPDYDCATGSGDGPDYVEGPVRVVGDDHFGLDADGNEDVPLVVELGDGDPRV